MRNSTIKYMDQTIESYLCDLMMCFGDTSMCVCYNYVKDSCLMFSKWINWWYLMHLNKYDLVKGLPFAMTKQRFISKITHRTVLDVEIMLDIDDEVMFKNILDLNFIDIKAKSDYIMDNLEKPYVCYFTQSKSYHISIIWNKLRDMTDYQRERVKEQIIDSWGGDLAKKSKRCMIAIEDGIHYKSKKNKILVRSRGIK